MNGKEKLACVVQGFFQERLGKQRQSGRNTIEAYRDAIKKFLEFLRDKYGDSLSFEMLVPENVVSFIDEYSRKGVSANTVNHRLAVIKSLVKYIMYRHPEDIDTMSRILYISPKRAVRKLICYLERNEIEAVINACGTMTPDGRRHHAILSFMYNTGARASEVTALNIGQLRLDTTKSVELLGKGSKERTLPLWPETISMLREMIKGRENCREVPVFLNKAGQRLTRKGIAHILDIAYAKARKSVPSLVSKHISPHSIRHTTAMHLLQGGNDINTVRLWLGHKSIETTNLYIELDLDMKRKALAKAELAVPAFKSKKWKPPKDILDILENL